MAETRLPLFNFEREFSQESNLVISQAAKQSCEQQQRDVYESHRHRAFSLAFYMTGNEMEAEEILATTFVKVFQQNERPDAFAVDSALLHELSEKFPLREEEAPAVVAPGMGLNRRNVRRPDLEEAVRNLPANERLVVSSTRCGRVYDGHDQPPARYSRGTGATRLLFRSRSPQPGARRASPQRSRLTITLSSYSAAPHSSLP